VRSLGEKEILGIRAVRSLGEEKIRKSCDISLLWKDLSCYLE